MSTSPQRSGTAAHPWDGIHVLREYELLDGSSLSATSLFADDTWLLAPASHQRHTRALCLRFDSIPARYRLLAKELLGTYMAMPLPPGEERLSIASVRKELTELRRLFKWLDARPGQPALAALTGTDAADYSSYLHRKVRSQDGQARSRTAVRRIWRFRDALPGDRLLFDPLHAEGWAHDNARRRSGENSTDRIPEDILGPLIAWAVRFVDDFAPDILAAAREWAQLRANRPPPARRRHRALLPALDELLARHMEEGRPLPGREGGLNYSFLARALSCSRDVLRRTPAYAERISAAAALLGIDDSTYFYTPVTAVLDGEPWLGKISHQAGDDSLPALSRLLQAACYILLSYLSGMRDSEVKHLKRGCLRIERDAEGAAYRWKVRGLAFKGERDRKGVPATWMVGAPAARAIGVLEALQPEDAGLLFQSLPYGTGWADGHAGRALTSSQTNISLNRFVTWVSDYCASRGRADGIPDAPERPFRIKTSHFRRTLAWFIARRPGGVIAGAIAYRHMSIQMFEGYAGTSDSGFRAEVESEQALARGEYLIDMTDTRRHENLTGPGAEEAERRMAEFGLRATGFGGNVITDRHRLLRLMEAHDPAIYPGKYVTCIYRHEKALCRLRLGPNGSTMPELGDCKPLACQNVALTPQNKAEWQAELSRIDQQLAARPRLPPVLEQRLQQRRNQISEFLARNA